MIRRHNNDNRAGQAPPEGERTMKPRPRLLTTTVSLLALLLAALATTGCQTSPPPAPPTEQLADPTATTPPTATKPPTPTIEPATPTPEPTQEPTQEVTPTLSPEEIAEKEREQARVEFEAQHAANLAQIEANMAAFENLSPEEFNAYVAQYKFFDDSSGALPSASPSAESGLGLVRTGPNMGSETYHDTEVQGVLLGLQHIESEGTEDTSIYHLAVVAHTL